MLFIIHHLHKVSHTFFLSSSTIRPLARSKSIITMSNSASLPTTSSSGYINMSIYAKKRHSSILFLPYFWLWFKSCAWASSCVCWSWVSWSSAWLSCLCRSNSLSCNSEHFLWKSMHPFYLSLYDRILSLYCCFMSCSFCINSSERRSSDYNTKHSSVRQSSHSSTVQQSYRFLQFGQLLLKILIRFLHRD